MRTVALADIAEKIDYGVTASAQIQPVGPKFLRITDIQDDAVNWDTVPFCEATAHQGRYAALASGDIVFARTGATTGKSYLIDECPEGAVFASYLIRVRPNDKVDGTYLARFFQSANYWSQIASKANGAAQPGVNASKLSELSVPLPPLPQQRRIAAILDRADALRKLRRRSLTLLDDLLRSQMNAIIIKTTARSAGSQLSGCFRDIKIGPFGSLLHKADYVEGGVPLINPMHIRSGKIFPDSRYSVSDAKARELASYRLTTGDIVLGRRGEMGRAAFVSREHNGFLCGTGSMILRVSPDIARPEFVSDFLSAPIVVSALEKAAGGVTMANLNTNSFDKVSVRLPALELQAEYLRLKETTKTKAEPAMESGRILDRLFASLQHRAFRGEL